MNGCMCVSLRMVVEMCVGLIVCVAGCVCFCGLFVCPYRRAHVRACTGVLHDNCQYVCVCVGLHVPVCVGDVCVSVHVCVCVCVRLCVYVPFV